MLTLTGIGEIIKVLLQCQRMHDWHILKLKPGRCLMINRSGEVQYVHTGSGVVFVCCYSRQIYERMHEQHETKSSTKSDNLFFSFLSVMYDTLTEDELVMFTQVLRDVCCFCCCSCSKADF